MDDFSLSFVQDCLVKRILLVGVFKRGSSNNQMVTAFQNLGFRPICFDYRARGNWNYFEGNRRRSLAGIFFRLMYKAKSYSSLFSRIFFRLPNIRRMNLELYDLAERTNHISGVVICKGDIVDPVFIRKCSAKTLLFFMDPVDEYVRSGSNSLAMACDFRCFTFSDLANSVSGSSRITQGAEFRFPVQGLGSRHGIVFIGSLTEDRREKLAELEDLARVKIDRFGNGWPRGPLERSNLVSVYSQYLFCVNLCRGGAGYSLRVFDAISAGAIIVSDYSLDLWSDMECGLHFLSFDQFATVAESLTDNNLETLRYLEKIRSEAYLLVSRNHSWEETCGKLASFF